MNKYEEALKEVINIAKSKQSTFADYDYETNKEIVEDACKKLKHLIY